MATPAGEAVLLGMLQGVTEFLPVSSSGHLALAQMLFGVEEASLTLNVMLHGGTLLATLIILRRRIGEITVALLDAVRRPSTLVATEPGRDALLVVVASVPTGIIGLTGRDLIARWTQSPLVVAVGFLITSALLVSVRWLGSGRTTSPPLGHAILLGIVQGIAVVPGISRSGSTIAAALWLGVRPDRAFELSMLMSLPAVLGAVLLEAPAALAMSGGGGFASFVLGPLVAFGVGLAALRLLRYSVARGYFSLFVLWVFPLALATLALAWALPASAGAG
jgi:undecaprenyl-diphosphatase